MNEPELSELSELLDLEDVERVAAGRLDEMALGYYAGGSGEERTLRNNRAAWAELDVWYRTLVDVSSCSTTTSLLGLDMPAPVLVAPTALHRLAHPDGELATARACSGAGIPIVVSSLASTLLEDICAVTDAPVLMQLYIGQRPEVSEALVARAEAAGCAGIQLTVDTPVWGERHREHRTGFHLPEGVDVVNLRRHAPEPAGAADGAADGASDGARDGASDGASGGIGEILGWAVSPSVTWDDLARLCGSTSLPVLTKGVCRPDDARRAIEAGAAGVVVSNHGGRQLDGAPATAVSLGPVASAVRSADPGAIILVDGGIRAGVDVLRALALGAHAVQIGRPVLWGLAAGGQDGVRRVLDLLIADVRRCMTLAGCPTVGDVTAELLAPD